MKKHFSLVLCAAMAAIPCRAQTQSVAAPAQAPASSFISINTATPITSDITMSVVNSDGTQQAFQGKFYRSSDGKIREDSPAGSVITDRKAGTITTLNPASNRAIVTPTPGPKGRYVQRPAPPNDIQMIDIGQTTVEGHPVNMRRVVQASSSGYAVEIWTATDLRLTVLVKSTGPSGRVTTKQYQNLQSVEPDPSLFTVPAGYTITVQPVAAPAVNAQAQ